MPNGHGSKAMVPFWDRCTRFRTYLSGWIGMFADGAIWIWTHGLLFVLFEMFRD